MLLLFLALVAMPAQALCSGIAALRGGAVRRASRASMLDDGIVERLSEEEAAVVSWLSSEEMGQAHLFEGWESKLVDDKRRLIEQVVAMDDAYPEDAEGRAGLTAYVAHAKELLALSATGANPFEGYSVEVPEGEVQDIGSETFRSNEVLGLSQIQNAAFVLVAGGLGERLGYDGIKVELPAETLTCASFLETYITALLAMQRNGADPSRPIPLIIMTSNDTHERTLELLEAANYYGVPKDQIHFIKQSNVPAIENNDGRFAQKDDKFALQTKPHGHGDVYTLLHTSGCCPSLPPRGGRTWSFSRDTNVLAFKAIPAALGVSIKMNLAMNSLTVPRSPGEAAGAICKLVRDGEPPLVINVEYNQLEPLLKASGLGGDTADAKRPLPYPGNVNTLIFALEPYAAALQATGGSMPEFVNPKYANAEKTQFKPLTRLECMMQDFPKLLTPDVSVGFTSFDRWFSFSPVKNSIAEAIASHEKGVFAASPGAGEAAVYECNARIFGLAGAEVGASEPVSFLGLPLVLGPAIALSPNFALSVDEVIRRCPGGARARLGKSQLVLDGDVTLHSLDLDGALSIKACPGASVAVRECTIANAGWAFEPMEPGSAPKAVSIRGYAVGDRSAGVSVEIDELVQYELSGAGELKKL